MTKTRERLSAVDAAYVRMEASRTPMHTARVLIFRLPPGESELWLRALVAEMRRTRARSGLYVRRLARSGRWHRSYEWERAPEVDLEHHLRYWRVDDPGDDAALNAMLQHAFVPALDMRRPLWECHVLGNLSGNRFAILLKTHHAAQDGFGATSSLLRWLSEDSAHYGPAAPWALDEPGSDGVAVPATHRQRKWIADAAGEERHHRLRAHLPGKRLLVWLESLSVRRDARRAQRSRPGGGLYLAMDVPDSPLGARLSFERNFAHHTFALSRFRALADRSGATVNEVAMTVIGGALRNWLLADRALPADPLIASVPVGLPRTDGRTGNAGTALFCTLGTDVADPAARLAAVMRGSRYAKALLASLPTAIIEQLTASATWRLNSNQLFNLSALRRPFFNVAISNGIYSREPLYLRGAELLVSHPCSVVFDGHALNITIVGYAGRLTMAFSGCPVATPDLALLTRLTDEALDALEHSYTTAPSAAIPVPA